MDNATMISLGKVGAFAAMTISAIGSGFGAGAAASSAVGAWKKCYLQKRPAPFQLAVFVGAPLTQTIYGFILLTLASKSAEANPGAWAFLLGLGLLSGLAMGISAWMQGVAAAGCCDAFAEANEGFTNNLMVLGIIETVALLTMVFSILALPKAA